MLQVIENDLRSPSAGEARIKILAAAVCRPDITVRKGVSPYSGTPLGHKFPFVPGYSIVGVVDAVGRVEPSPLLKGEIPLRDNSKAFRSDIVMTR